MQATSTFAVALVQSRLVGDTKGNAFNDVESIGHYPADLTINVDHAISKVQVLYGAVIDGLTITYNETAGNATESISHGTEPGSTDASLQRKEFDLSADENIIAISGKAGVHPTFGKRVIQISFIIYNGNTGQSRIAGPYGNIDNGNYGTAFRVTANGAFIAFGGYAVTSNDSIAQAIRAGRPGGLYGLTFTDVAYRQA